MGLRKHRGRGDFKGKYLSGKGRGNDQERQGQENDLEMENAKEEQSGEFSRRKIESNAEKYDLPLHSDESSGDEEVRDFDYIKNNEAGLHSHFKFKEEKDWDDVHSPETVNFLQLDLNKLAKDISSVGIYKLLQLNKLKNECQYCVESLKNDILENEELDDKNHSNDSPSIDCYAKAFEVLREKIVPCSDFHIKITNSNQTQKPKNCRENKGRSIIYKDASNQTEILSNKNLYNSFESIINLNKQTSEAELTTMENLESVIKQEDKRLSQDIDLDKLLAISDSHTDFRIASEEQNNQEDLCDWLDDLLNRP
ncbi:uncharacterized protein LOC101238827 isoform X1 [Hydra vulgaris]|uniref:uncharacterized protein LOC101238827 isoform X1 n=1 Tax=Hydra vulgaris TaxID=6087 RepID=UPI0006413C3D|nr:uncharacterized protein LOC101238827 [Hydra vulgaris]